MPKRKPLEVRFWERVKKGAQDDCWEWQGPKKPKGYGVAWNGATATLAHRVAWELAYGPITDPEIFVCHACDNPPCCNPNHLWLGSNADNMRDMHEKKRGRSRARLFTPEQARKIKQLIAEGVSYNSIGEKFGVAPSVISQIGRGLTYRDI